MRWNAAWSSAAAPRGLDCGAPAPGAALAAPRAPPASVASSCSPCFSPCFSSKTFWRLISSSAAVAAAESARSVACAFCRLGTKGCIGLASSAAVATKCATQSRTRIWSCCCRLSNPSMHAVDATVFVFGCMRENERKRQRVWYHCVLVFGASSLCSDGGTFPRRSSLARMCLAAHFVSRHLERPSVAYCATKRLSPSVPAR
mmetsp:Transcript_25980/g.89348  ORF Transcript_25980/g.89348 Transcript_25980/m.89348 type:complete len:202 (-) Transcript_25980:476-1081(-)